MNGRGPRRAGLWAAYLLLVGSCTVLAVEVGARLLRLAPPVPVEYAQLVEDDGIPFRRQPYSRISGRSTSDEFDFEYLHNSMGFRDVEHALDKPDGVFRIIALGDSFTYGVGGSSDESYPSTLQRLLDGRTGDHPTIEVINFGIPRFWTEPERRLLERYGLAYKPDLVLIGFVPNDVADTSLGYEGLQLSGGYLITRQAARLGAFGVQLALHSHLFRLMVAGSRSLGGSPVEASYRADDIYKPDGYHEKDWRSIEREMETILQLSSAHHAKMCIIHIPQKGPWRDEARYPATRLSRWSQQHGVAFVDTLGALELASADRSLFWQKDGHPNGAGYRVIAESVYSGLVAHGLVP
jgi:lysophospholipase L1-like esterase